MSKREIRQGDIFNYRPANNWCRHGSAVVNRYSNGDLYAQDTYWNGISERYSEYGGVSFELLEAGEYVGNRDEFRAVRCDEYNKFAAKDRFYLPVGGGSEAYYVRRDAKHDAETAVRFLRNCIEEEEYALRRAQRRIEEYQKEIETYNVEIPDGN